MQIFHPRAPRALPEKYPQWNVAKAIYFMQSTKKNYFDEISEKKNYFMINKKALLEISCTHNYTRTQGRQYVLHVRNCLKTEKTERKNVFVISFSLLLDSLFTQVFFSVCFVFSIPLDCIEYECVCVDSAHVIHQY